jgi:hypothetical protein
MKRMTRNWRKYLTEQERKEIMHLDARIKKMDSNTDILRSRRNKIQNRATARARPQSILYHWFGKTTVPKDTGKK